MQVTIRLILLGLVIGTSNLSSAQVIKLKNESTGRCLNIHGGRADREGGPVTSYTCTNTKDQEWKLMLQGDGYMKLKNRRTDRCLNVHGRDDRQGGRVTSYSCTDTHDQEWGLIRLSESKVKLRNRQSGRCLNIHGGRHDHEGGPATVYSCSDTPDQNWELIQLGDTAARPRCMDHVIETYGKSSAMFRGARERRAKRRAQRRWQRAVEGRLRGARGKAIPAAGTDYSDLGNAEIESFNCKGRPLKCILRARPCRY